LKIANESNHRRNTTLPKTNFNYRSEVRKADLTTLIDQQQDEEKVVEINDFLKMRIDPTKLNIRMFQEKI
jgi:hypothetical protein